jgi:predicted RNA-binding Zn ribbon-like protein
VSDELNPNTCYEVSGVVVPTALAGHPGLELCNTFAGWDEPEGREYLLTYDHLVVWARERELIGDASAAALVGRRGRAADAVLDRTRSLRGAVYAVLTSGPVEAAWATIAQEAEEAAGAASFVRHGDGAAWVLPETLALPLRAAAAAVADLLIDPPRVGRCPGHDCGWLFVNPRGTRRWCSMAVCGNRAKVARHARRH